MTVAGPDGRNVLPAFTSVAAMQRVEPEGAAGAGGCASASRWPPRASRPTSSCSIRPRTTEFVIRRPALWAIAQSQPWIPSYLDPEVLDEFMASASRRAQRGSDRAGAGRPGCAPAPARNWSCSSRSAARPRPAVPRCPARAPAAALGRERPDRSPRRLPGRETPPPPSFSLSSRSTTVLGALATGRGCGGPLWAELGANRQGPRV